MKDSVADDDAIHESRLVVGMVRGLHGLRGGVRIEILTDDPARFQPGSVLYPEGSDEPLTVEWSHEDGPGVLVRFEEFPIRELAATLRDRYLEAEVSTDALDDGAFYWHELIEVPVTTSDGELLGTVADVFRAGGGEVLVVRGGERGEVLVPAVKAVVTELAPRDGRIVVERDALDIQVEPPRKRPRGRRTTRALRSAIPE